MRVVVVVLALYSTASAETLDLEKTLERMKPCHAETLVMLGPIEKFESIGKRPELAEAAKVAYTSGGCDITVQTRRMVFDGAKFVAKGKPKIFTKKKFCECQK
jgi:hypothetical protein